MPHSGPLQDLPLERFLPPNPNPLQPNIRPSKRPLSPGGPNLLSPAKRRILNEEGLLLTDKAKTPLSHSLRQLSPSRFTGVLNSPASPARVLDFGLPKYHSLDNTCPSRSDSVATGITPRRPITRSMSQLAPSPELPSVPASLRHVTRCSTDVGHPLAACSSCPVAYIPRDLPPLPDPQSIHYPGFKVYRDPYTLLLSPVDDAHREFTKEGVKENVPCRRKGRKPAIDKVEPPSRATSLEPSGRENDRRMVKGKASVPCSPKKIFTMCFSGAITPPQTARRLGIGSLHLTSPTSNAKSPEGIRRERKMKMMQEVDEVTFSIDDEGGPEDILH
ncbi:hypothetical protein AX17_000961 [Amanita inopinata Kibby_2008]|nr:hypothetical protein AX17_000961 [Amanita inopinata Kibby_2008]